MNNIYKLSIVALLFASISCNRDFLDEKSPTQIPIELAVRSTADLDKAVVGIYSAIERQQLNDVINFSELITDNAMLSNANNGQYSEMYNMSYANNTDKIERLWNGYNDMIIKANWVLSYEGKIIYNAELDQNQSTFDAKTKNLFAEARALRAYARVILAGYFSERLGGDNQQLGIVINNTYDPNVIDATFPRSTVPQTYAAIEEDLLKAISDFSTGGVVAKSARMNLLAANVLMSRVSLYERKWNNANFYAAKARDLADSAGVSETAMATPFPLQDGNNPSSIFQFVFNSGNALGINSLYSYWAENGQYNQFFATKEFFDLIASGDRRSSIYKPFISIYDSPENLYYAKKFGTGPLYDVVIVRKAEIDFNEMEATYYTDPTAAKNKLVNWVKSNRYSGYSFNGNGVDVLNEILLQRRIEFAFEGHRFMDLKRNDLGWEKGANYKGGQPVVSISDKKQCLPIPLVEVTANPKMIQNPGY